MPGKAQQRGIAFDRMNIGFSKFKAQNVQQTGRKACSASGFCDFLALQQSQNRD
jgi:hypothetical protein